MKPVRRDPNGSATSSRFLRSRLAYFIALLLANILFHLFLMFRLHLGVSETDEQPQKISRSKNLHFLPLWSDYQVCSPSFSFTWLLVWSDVVYNELLVLDLASILEILDRMPFWLHLLLDFYLLAPVCSPPSPQLITELEFT